MSQLWRSSLVLLGEIVLGVFGPSIDLDLLVEHKGIKNMALLPTTVLEDCSLPKDLAHVCYADAPIGW